MNSIKKSENVVTRHHLWISLNHAVQASGDPALRMRLSKFVKSDSSHLETLFSTHRPNFEPGADNEADWIFSDLREMKKMLAQRSIPLLLQTYPPLRYQDEAYPVDEVIRRFAEEESISLSDTYTFLRLKFAAGEKQAFYPVKNPGDLHLNGRGYGLVADLLRRDLARLGLVQEAGARDRVTQSGTPH